MVKRYFFVSERLPADMEEVLSAYGVCVRLPAFSALPEPVSRHPDMLMARIAGTLVIHGEYVRGQALLESLNVPYTVSETAVGREYPRDIALNCFEAGGFFFAHGTHVSGTARCLAVEAGFVPVSVKQGYAKCSTVVMRDAVATADSGIYDAAIGCGLRALLLKPETIGIERYDTGFIGGACGAVDERTLAFFGDVTSYGQYEALRTFYASAGVGLVSLGKGRLFDYGGIVSYPREL